MKTFLSILLLASVAIPAAAQEGHRYAMLIGGLGGSPEYTEQFQQYLFETQRALVEQFGLPEANVTVLAEASLQDLAFVDDVSTAEAIRARFEALAASVGASDQVYVILFGHGSYDGEHAQLNIPRRDLNDADYADLVGALGAGRVVFVNTASASAPFIEALSAPDRIIITATRAGTQRNETVFPQFFVEALTSAAADLDKNGDLSVRELFQYAAEATARSFEESNLLATEHALLDDTGDGQGYRVDELNEAGEGNLASVTYLRRSGAVATARSPEAAQMLRQRDDLERDIASLKSQKQQLDEDTYYAQLETLFVRLARLNDRLEAQQ